MEISQNFVAFSEYMNFKLIFIFIAAQEVTKEVEQQFTCNDGAKIPLEFRCDDLEWDCQDNSDEIDCTPGKLKLEKNGIILSK